MAGGRDLIDAHVHLVTLGERPEHGHASRYMLHGPTGLALRSTLGLPPPARRAELSRVFEERLIAELGASRRVRAVVALALDGVYDPAGRLDLDSTALYVPNDAVLDLARRQPGVLAGVSVNPRRRDALEELARVDEAGAALLKWLPNAQGFDPADPALRPFYRELARRRLPLLLHAGFEFAIRARDQRLGQPSRWRAALEEGVAVIGAHAGSSGLVGIEPNARVVLDLLERYPNLWLDSSALAYPGRGAMLRRLARRGLLDRLTFATDWPMPVRPVVCLLSGGFAAWRRARAERNYFDRYVAYFEARGWQPSSAPLERLLAARREAA